MERARQTDPAPTMRVAGGGRVDRSWIPIIILLVIVIARLGFAGLVFARPELALANDTDRYVPIAKGILSGTAYAWNTDRTGELLNTVGYPLFLAGVYAVAGTAPGSVALAQLMVSGALALAVYLVMRRPVGRPAAFIAAAILALDPLGILWSMTVLTETLLAVCLGLAALMLVGWSSSLSSWRLITAGLLMGMACLVKPYALLVAALWALGLLVFPSGGHGPRLPKLVQGVRLMGMFLLPIAVLVIPWIVRNGLLWNCPALSSVDRVTMRDYVAAKIMQETEGLSLDAAQAELRSQDPGICPTGNARYVSMILSNPGVYLKLHVAGTIPVLFGSSFDRWIEFSGVSYAFPDLWQPFMQGGLGEVVRVIVHELFRFPAGPILMVVLILWQVLVYVLAVLGVLVYRKVDSWPLRWTLAVMTLSVVLLVLTPGQGGNERFRIPVQPLLAILIAYGAACSIVPALRGASSGCSDEGEENQAVRPAAQGDSRAGYNGRLEGGPHALESTGPGHKAVFSPMRKEPDLQKRATAHGRTDSRGENKLAWT
jgi:4-amino-4-deoxy-L-arabinose transferase-like glycosyltransferase